MNILPLFYDKQIDTDDRVLYWEFPGKQRAARHGDWKAVTIKPNKPLELYNLREDPEEKHDLAKKYPEMVIGFDKVMKEMRTPSENWQYRKMRTAGKSNWHCKTEGVSWIYDTPSVFFRQAIFKSEFLSCSLDQSAKYLSILRLSISKSSFLI